MTARKPSPSGLGGSAAPLFVALIPMLTYSGLSHAIAAVQYLAKWHPRGKQLKQKTNIAWKYSSFQKLTFQGFDLVEGGVDASAVNRPELASKGS